LYREIGGFRGSTQAALAALFQMHPRTQGHPFFNHAKVSVSRERHNEGTALAQGGFNTNTTPRFFDDFFDKGEAYADALDFIAGVEGLEHLEDGVEVFSDFR
jgi:hypothetical protein